MYLIVTRTFPPDLGGMQMLSWGLATTLSKHYKIKVFADYHKDQTLHDKNVNFEIERVGGFKFIRKFRKANLVNNFIKKNKVEGIIADHWKSLELVKYQNNSIKKKLCLIHSKEINHDLGSNLNHRVLKVLNNIDYVIANSEFTKKLAIKIGVHKKKITVINPGILSLEEIKEENKNKANKILSDRFPKLITISRFDKRKNHEKIIMAVRNLKEIYPNIIYICIGQGEEEENLKKLSLELNLSDQIIFLKNIDNNYKNALLSQSNLFVMPSIKFKKSVEGFGIVFVEAAQYGVPSLGGIEGGEADAIIQNKTGLLCDGNNLNEIYKAIDSFFKDKKYIEFSKNAKIHSEKFNWKNIILQYKKILK